ncbi:MAG: RNA-binding protein [Brasilonema angustatum HA4187-MV1]|jgi:RNA recognition motif-containing protein|nr:RNA-binding protein [Brasilonema angustatum HA4187-MV1]
MTLLVGNLPCEVTEANLKELFTKFGTVEKIDIFPGSGFATVTIEGEANEERAVQELNGVEKFGQKLQLFKSAPVKPSDNPRQGGGGRVIEGLGDGPGDVIVIEI